MPPERHLLVGLGNPGREYRLNRHNVGFLLLDRLVEKHRLLGFTKRQGKALITSGVIAGVPVVLAKPQTYMNLSGEAVSALVRFYQTPLERLLISFDEIDLPLGTLRLRPEGGSAGHNGMRSIIEQLGTEQFPRLRLGIGRPPGVKAAAGYVLRDFRGEDLEIITLTLDRAADAVECFLREGLTTAMNRYNGAAEQP
ncbi:MAG: aminoacyl-tRNA hydrolase [Anaerolineales bacterium]|nr:aminoacyl-tRNA hydrolase [Anaerolineales bacterium]